MNYESRRKLKMIFISSIVPLNQIPDTTEQIIDNEWFLFSSMITSKNYLKEDELSKMYNRIEWYLFFYRQKLYSYLISNNYYYKSKLYETMGNICELICMNRVKIYEDVCNCNRNADKKIEIIKEPDFAFTKEDIEDMFLTFKGNNFRINPVCEVVLGCDK